MTNLFGLWMFCIVFDAGALDQVILRAYASNDPSDPRYNVILYEIPEQWAGLFPLVGLRIERIQGGTPASVSAASTEAQRSPQDVSEVPPTPIPHSGTEFENVVFALKGVNAAEDPPTVWRRLGGPRIYPKAKDRGATDDLLKGYMLLVSELGLNPKHRAQMRTMTGIEDVCNEHAARIQTLIKNHMEQQQRTAQWSREKELRATPFVSMADLCPSIMNAGTRVAVTKQLMARFRKTTLETYPSVAVRVRRSDVLFDSIEALEKVSPVQLVDDVRIEFVGEAGFDGGGLRREWLEALSSEMFGIESDLVHYDENDKGVVSLNPELVPQTEYYPYYGFMGKIIGMALVQGKPLGVKLSLVTLGYLVGNNKVILKDIEADFPTDHNMMLSLLMAKNMVNLDMLTFSGKDPFGNEVDWIEGGSHIRLRMSNKQQYVDHRLQFVYITKVKPLLDQMRKGFRSVVPVWVLFSGVLSAKSMQELLLGEREISVSRLKTATKYSFGITTSTPQVMYFWNVVGRMSQADRLGLLKFWTGFSVLPVDGLSGIQLLLDVDPSRNEHLPTARTCFYKLTLGAYISEAVMSEKLLFAIANAGTFETD